MEHEIKRFAFSRDVQITNIGAPIPAYRLVVTTMKSGTSTSYTEKPFDVEGVFRIKPEAFEGTDKADLFYWFDDAEIVKE